MERKKNTHNHPSSRSCFSTDYARAPVRRAFDSMIRSKKPLPPIEQTISSTQHDVFTKPVLGNTSNNSEKHSKCSRQKEACKSLTLRGRKDRKLSIRTRSTLPKGETLDPNKFKSWTTLKLLPTPTLSRAATNRTARIRIKKEAAMDRNERLHARRREKMRQQAVLAKTARLQEHPEQSKHAGHPLRLSASAPADLSDELMDETTGMVVDARRDSQFEWTDDPQVEIWRNEMSVDPRASDVVYLFYYRADFGFNGLDQEDEQARERPAIVRNHLFKVAVPPLLEGLNVEVDLTRLLRKQAEEREALEQKDSKKKKKNKHRKKSCEVVSDDPGDPGDAEWVYGRIHKCLRDRYEGTTYLVRYEGNAMQAVRGNEASNKVKDGDEIFVRADVFRVRSYIPRLQLVELIETESVTRPPLADDETAAAFYLTRAKCGLPAGERAKASEEEHKRREREAAEALQVSQELESNKEPQILGVLAPRSYHEYLKEMAKDRAHRIGTDKEQWLGVYKNRKKRNAATAAGAGAVAAVARVGATSNSTGLSEGAEGGAKEAETIEERKARERNKKELDEIKKKIDADKEKGEREDADNDADDADDDNTDADDDDDDDDDDDEDEDEDEDDNDNDGDDSE